MPDLPDSSHNRLMSTKDEIVNASFQRPSYRQTCSVSDSSTLVDAPISSFKPKIIGSRIDESPAAVEKEDDSEDEWIDGKDYPQFVNKDETWKTITASDLKRCITRFFGTADVGVVEGGRRVMPRVIPVSPPMTEETLQKVRAAVQVLNEAVADGQGEITDCVGQNVVHGMLLFLRGRGFIMSRQIKSSTTILI